MLKGPLDVAELRAAAAAHGLHYEPPDTAVELWAEHVRVVALFRAMQTQWNVGMNGPIGLRYEALPAVERQLGISPRRAKRMFSDLRVMERAALEWFGKRREELAAAGS